MWSISKKYARILSEHMLPGSKNAPSCFSAHATHLCPILFCPPRLSITTAFTKSSGNGKMAQTGSHRVQNSSTVKKKKKKHFKWQDFLYSYFKEEGCEWSEEMGKLAVLSVNNCRAHRSFHTRDQLLYAHAFASAVVSAPK